VNDADERDTRRFWVRLLWFVGLWLAGVGVVLLVSLLIRAVLH
jgi:hypothetical protein